MKQSDVNRMVRVFDRHNGRGIVGQITQVLNDTTFRMITDNGTEFEFSTSGDMNVRVQFIERGDF